VLLAIIARGRDRYLLEKDERFLFNLGCGEDFDVSR
jgi:hypothetical protein